MQTKNGMLTFARGTTGLPDLGDRGRQRTVAGQLPPEDGGQKRDVGANRHRDVDREPNPEPI